MSRAVLSPGDKPVQPLTPAERRYKSYLVGFLTLVLTANYIDQRAIGILVQDIKMELVLSDTQVGLLTGIAFALFYSVMGIPIARWADRGNRVTIIACTAALWSAMVALCGLAANFTQLILCRVGVAIGEAGSLPAGHSLIADTFSREERPRVVSRYMLGVPISSVIGFFAAGWLNELLGWRMTFMVLGLPGLAIALLAWLTLREPRCGIGEDMKTRSAEGQGMSILEVLAVLWSIRSFRHLMIAFAVLNFFGNGIAQWKPAFFMRSFGLGTGEVGTWFALVYGLTGVVGTYLGGELAARFAPNDEKRQLTAIALLYVIYTGFTAGTYLASSATVAFVFLGVATLGVFMVQGPLFATMQTLAPPSMRAMSIAVTYFFANLIGMGLGPLAAGALSDAFQSWAGAESLRYSLLAFCPGYLWVAWHLWKAAATVDAELQASLLVGNMGMDPEPGGAGQPRQEGKGT
jgi:MFS family permease